MSGKRSKAERRANRKKKNGSKKPKVQEPTGICEHCIGEIVKESEFAGMHWEVCEDLSDGTVMIHIGKGEDFFHARVDAPLRMVLPLPDEYREFLAQEGS